MEVGLDDYIIMRAKLRNQVRDGMNEYTWIEKEWRCQNRTREKVSRIGEDGMTTEYH